MEFSMQKLISKIEELRFKLNNKLTLECRLPIRKVRFNENLETVTFEEIDTKLKIKATESKPLTETTDKIPRTRKPKKVSIWNLFHGITRL